MNDAGFTPKSVSEAWVNNQARLILAGLLHRHPAAEINPNFTSGYIEHDGITLTIRVDFNSELTHVRTRERRETVRMGLIAFVSLVTACLVTVCVGLLRFYL